MSFTKIIEAKEEPITIKKEPMQKKSRRDKLSKKKEK
jgi:hypothetical protein